jgi:hypothetical protein
MFSRSGVSNELGKCTEEAKTLLPEEVKEKLTALAVLKNQTLSEYLRDMCVVHVYGHLYVARVQHGLPKREGQE